jgi:hypothetical protein
MKWTEKLQKKIATTTGFEPVRANPSDFESDSLTTRTDCLGMFVALQKNLTYLV